MSVLFPEPAVIISGCYDKHIRSFDLREKDYSMTVCGRHAKAVLCLAPSDDSHYIYSGSEDRCVKLWDRRSPDNVVDTHKVMEFFFFFFFFFLFLKVIII